MLFAKSTPLPAAFFGDMETPLLPVLFVNPKFIYTVPEWGLHRSRALPLRFAVRPGAFIFDAEHSDIIELLSALHE